LGQPTLGMKKSINLLKKLTPEALRRKEIK
jgi:hypothetical protein